MASDPDTAMDEQPSLVTSELQDLRHQNAVLQNKLDRSVAEIMRLQGGMDQITDGDVKKRFEAIFGAIQNWVAEVELDLMRHSRDFREVFQEILHREERESLLLSLRLRAHDEDKNGYSVWDSASEDHSSTRWLGTLDTCISVVLSRFIWWRLYHQVFYSIYPAGLDEGVRIGLDYIIKAIASGDPGETNSDTEAILRANKWRAESMARLVRTRKFQTDKEAGLRNISDDLYDDLTQETFLIEPKTLDRHIKSLEINVIGPSVELNHTIACSTTEYIVEEPRMELLQHIRNGNLLQDFILKDVVEWRNRDPSEIFGDVFWPLFPGINRKEAAKAGDLKLVKPTVLVLNRETFVKLREYEISHDPARKRRQKSPEKAESALSRKSSPSPLSSRASTGKSANDRQSVPHRKREDPLPESSNLWRRAFTSLPKAFGNERKIGEKSFTDAKPRPQRRATEDRSTRGTPPSEPKGKEKRSKRAEQTPASPRKLSVSHAHPGIATATGPSSEHVTVQHKQPPLQENRQEPRELDDTHRNNMKDLPSPPTLEASEDETESSSTSSPMDVRLSLEAERENDVHYRTARPQEANRPVGSTRYELVPHPNSQQFREVQSQYCEPPHKTR